MELWQVWKATGWDIATIESQPAAKLDLFLAIDDAWHQEHDPPR